MSYVAQVPEQEAVGELKALYDQIGESYPRIPNFFTALGSHPQIISGILSLSAGVMREGALSRDLKERIGLVVSGINHSSYCIAIHSQVLNNLGVPRNIARQLAIDYPSAPSTPAEQALFRFADKLTRHGEDIQPADIEELRGHGWQDAHILELVATIAYFNFVNRISIGLGLVPDF